ncbi:MAG TPA: YbaK/EbsC family protein [Thermoflexales bacterium]|nr:YbaK/EbsC family protein [Thermoflexales bacterium]
MSDKDERDDASAKSSPLPSSSFAEFEKKLLAYIHEHKIECQHLVFAQSTHSVDEAARAAGATAHDFVKSVGLISKSNQIVVAIVKGEDRADRAATQALAGVGKLSIASPNEMLEFTSYPAGGTPPFGFAALFFVDERVLEREFVYAGGGSPRALIRISPREILRANGGRVGVVRKIARES